MENKHTDIETIIIDIERAELIANDRTIDRDIREDALSQFVKRTSSSLITLLDELKTLRNIAAKGNDSGAFKKTHRVILEGYSDKDGTEALSTALDKAAKYFSEDHDVSITVQQLIELPNGGHRATVEVHITPLSLREKPHIKGYDIELKRDHDKAFHDSRHKEDEALQHLIFDHFSALTKSKTNGHVPSSFLINVSDAKLMHYMLEKQFLRAEMQKKNLEEYNSLEPDAPHQILVQLKREID